MNIILTYKQVKEFSKDSQSLINKVQFSQIPEMRVLENVIEVDDKEVIEYTIPYQANATTEEFNSLKEMLELFGVVDIIGKWNDDGSKIECNSTKYKNALKDIEVFENAVFYDGVDYTGIEDTYIYIQDEDGVDIIPNVKSFVRVKESKRPTLAESKKIQVNTFNANITREL